MKAIIIEEDRFVDILNEFELMKEKLEKETTTITVNDIHRQFHYLFVNWAQSHGASCLRTRR